MHSYVLNDKGICGCFVVLQHKECSIILLSQRYKWWKRGYYPRCAHVCVIDTRRHEI